MCNCEIEKLLVGSLVDKRFGHLDARSRGLEEYQSGKGAGRRGDQPPGTLRIENSDQCDVHKEVIDQLRAHRATERNSVIEDGQCCGEALAIGLSEQFR
jgi:hypothetical protein